MQAATDSSSFYFVTEDLRLIADSARKVFEDLLHADTGSRQAQKRRLDRAAVAEALHGLGVFDTDAHESPMNSALVQVQVARESGAACLSYPILESLVSGAAVGTDCTPIAGAATLSTKNSEPADLPRLDAGCLTGVGHLVAFAESAGSMLLLARQQGSIVLVQAPLKASGVDLLPRNSVEPEYPLHDVRFHETVVGVVPLPGVDVGALQLRAQLLAATEISGACRRMVMMTRDYLLSRTQFGQTLGGNQALKHALADAHVRVEAMIAAIDYAAAAFDARAADAARAVAAAKLFSGNAGKRVAESMLQLHGAIGYTMEYPLQLLIRRVLRLASSHTAGDMLDRALFRYFQHDTEHSRGTP